MRKSHENLTKQIAGLICATADPKERLQRLRRMRALGDNPDKNQLVNLITEFEFNGPILPLTKRKALAPQEVAVSAPSPQAELNSFDSLIVDQARLARAAAKRLRKAKTRSNLIKSNSN